MYYRVDWEYNEKYWEGPHLLERRGKSCRHFKDCGDALRYHLAQVRNLHFSNGAVKITTLMEKPIGVEIVVSVKPYIVEQSIASEGE